MRPPSPIRNGAKRVVDTLAACLIAPIAGLCYLDRQLSRSRRHEAVQGYSQLVALIPGVVGVVVRRAFLRMTITRCSPASSVEFGTIFATTEVVIDDGVYIGAFCNVGHATIERDTLIGSNVTLLSGKQQHRFDRLDVPIRHQGGTYTRIKVGPDAWIGNGAVIMADVGAHAVVAAGAVVVKPVPAYAIVAGNPARVVSSRRPDSPDVHAALDPTEAQVQSFDVSS